MALIINPSEVAIEENLKQFLLVLSVSLSVATLPRIFSWFRQIPYTLLLVIVGLGLASVDVRLIDLSPGLILFIFLHQQIGLQKSEIQPGNSCGVG